LYVKITAGLFGLALLPAILLIIWAPQLFSWVFGSQWHSAGDLARWLVFWLLFSFCNLPAVLFARIIRIQRTVFIYDLILLAARTVSLLVGGVFLTANHTVLIFSLVGAIMNFVLILLVGFALMNREGKVSLDEVRQSLAEK